MEKLALLITKINNIEKAKSLLSELFTDNELKTLDKRWRILELLNQNVTQREIANKLNVSLCKVTRGSKILKNEKSVIKEFLNKGI